MAPTQGAAGAAKSNAVLGGHLGTVIATVAGVAIAGLAAVGVTSAFTSSPDPVNKPYVVYGSSDSATPSADATTSTDTSTPNSTTSASQ